MDDRQFFWLMAAGADMIAKSFAVDIARSVGSLEAARTTLSLAPAFEPLDFTPSAGERCNDDVC